MPIFGSHSTSIMQPSWNVVEEIAHCHRRSMHTCTTSTFHFLTSPQCDPYTSMLLTQLLRLNCTTQDGHFRDCNNTRKRFSTKAQRMQAAQILEGTYFTCCMSQAYTLEISFNNTIPIVSDADQAQPTATNLNANITCPCIHSILYEFFD